ncbi:hypothetical protein [Sinosporangium siamense]|uniref:Uncharacterized protein n=1 Tax=Sinosporangium siamense TaxID=1367973 RepID=A0A919RAE5_9ACTN|nr:hypothetical protein [Sinosporangium siamense]GII90336.1 hypothetical protein Ssi02_05670 [Sinosporangium siamense]
MTAITVSLALVAAAAVFGLLYWGGRSTEQESMIVPVGTAEPEPLPSPTRTAQARVTVTATPREAFIPKGWVSYRHPQGFSLAVPKGWTAVDDPERPRVEIRGKGSNGFLWVEWATPENPQDDQVAAWEELEKTILAEKGLPGYRRIGIRPLTYLGRPAADWEFTFESTADGTVRVIDRGFRTADGRHFALYWRVPDAEWSRDLHFFQNFARTFRFGSQAPGAEGRAPAPERSRKVPRTENSPGTP